jgi:hypothetical protein
MKVATVIPWRAGTCPYRIANADYVVAHYERLSLGPVVVVDDGKQSGPFNRSAAYNRGYARVPGDVDVILWNEADTLIPAAQIEEAARTAGERAGMVVPFTERHELTREQARLVHDGADPLAMTGGEKVYLDGRSIGQAGICSRASMDAIGGRWDQCFESWGYDDTAMFHVFRTLAGEPSWVQGKGVHLWHPHALAQQTDEQRAATRANKARSRRMFRMDARELRDFLASSTL